MIALSDLLLRYKVPGVRESEIRKICTEEVFALTGCKLVENQVKYRNEKLTLSVAPVIKSALRMREGELIERIKARSVAIRTIT